MSKLISCVAIAAMVLVWAGAAQATLLVYEPFNYTVASTAVSNGYGPYYGVDTKGLLNANGGGEINLKGGTYLAPNPPQVWQGWGGSNYVSVEASTFMTYPVGTNGVSTGNVAYKSTYNTMMDRGILVPINESTNPDLYFSVLMKAVDAPNTIGPWMKFMDASGGNGSVLLGWKSTAAPGPSIRGSIVGGAAITGPSAVQGTTYLLVAKLSDGTFSFWINPDLAQAENSAYNGTKLIGSGAAGTLTTLTQIQMGTGRAAYDEIRLGTTWADMTATSIPEPATMSLLVLGGLAALIRRRRSA